MNYRAYPSVDILDFEECNRELRALEVWLSLYPEVDKRNGNVRDVPDYCVDKAEPSKGQGFPPIDQVVLRKQVNDA